jgi:parvulin-like peptidyl-prolyl isomerase
MRGRAWALGVFAGAAMLGTFVERAHAQGRGQAVKPAAIVNGEPISLAEVEKFAAQVLRRPTPMSMTEAQKREIKAVVLAQLMDDLLMQQFLRKNAPKADLAEVNKKIADLEAGLKKQGKTLAEYLREEGQTEGELRVHNGYGLQWEAYAQKRITDQDVRHYFDENKDYFDQVEVRASHIVLRVPANSSDAAVQATQQQLLNLRQELLGGKIDFAEAAKKYSQCETAPQGGDIGKFKRREEMDENFLRTAFSMKPGEISSPVRSEFGWHLIRVTERTPGQPVDFEKVKDDVRRIYTNECYMGIIAQQRQAAKIDVQMP